MKRLFSVVSLLLLCITFTQAAMPPRSYGKEKAASYQVKGHLDGLDSDTLCIMVLNKGFQRCDFRDTLFCTNGDFQFNISDKFARNVMITPFNAGNNPSYLILMTVPGEQAIISGTLANHKITGSKYYQDAADYEATTKYLQDKFMALRDDFSAKVKAGADREKASAEYMANTEPISVELNEVSLNWVKKHPDSDYSCYIAGNNVNKIAEYESILTERARHGYLGAYIDEMKYMLESSQSRQENMKKIKAEATAPDFTLPQPDGTNISLHELVGPNAKNKGKYLMLDFWGSWCVWCIRGIPTLKEIYAKYKDKIEFLSIACNDSDEKWRNAMAKNQMPWLQAFNLEKTANDVDNMYGLQAFPTFIIINPEGKIVKQFTGESDEFKAFFPQTFGE